ncbi:AEC family transporter [Leifsonia sp. NPDC058248]|uniref:AEC family transporter n=1 Tax=Leifsonia sp. NPDC058248 TaxID=3346402 RepID=UPI0036DDAE68
MSVLAALLPVYFALGVGFAAGKFHVVENAHVDPLNKIVMTFALPLALFTILAGSKRADVLAHSAVAAAVFVVTAVTYAGTYVLQRTAFRQSTASSIVQSLTVAFPNAAAVGLPIADAALGNTGELAVAVSLAVGSIILTPVTIAVLNSTEQETLRPGSSSAPAWTKPLLMFARALRTPVVIAPILGLAWSLLGLPFPSLLRSTLMELGGLTAGLALFVTGLVLSGQHLRLGLNVGVSSLMADIGRPLLAVLVVKALGMTGPMAAEVVVLMAVPSGFFGVLLAVSHGVKVGVVGPTLFYSHVLSIATLSAVIVLLPLL